MEGNFWFSFYSLWLVCYKYTFHVSILSDTKESAANTTAGDDDKVKFSQLNPANSESIMYHHQPLYISLL